MKINILTEDSLDLKTIFPIFTFFLGFLVNRLYDLFLDRKSTIKMGKRWLLELQNLEHPMRYQIECLKEFEQNLRDDENLNSPPLTIFYDLKLEVFKLLDKVMLYNYIKLKSSRSIFGIIIKKVKEPDVVRITNNITGLIHVISNDGISLSELNDSYNSHMQIKRDKFYDNVNNFFFELRNFEIAVSSAGEDIYKDENVVSMFILFRENFENIEYYHPFILERDFFRPLQKILNEVRFDKRYDEIYKMTIECMKDIAAIKVERNKMAMNCNNFIDLYMQRLGEVELAIETMNNKL